MNRISTRIIATNATILMVIYALLGVIIHNLVWQFSIRQVDNSLRIEWNQVHGQGPPGPRPPDQPGGTNGPGGGPGSAPGGAGQAGIGGQLGDGRPPGLGQPPFGGGSGLPSGAPGSDGNGGGQPAISSTASGRPAPPDRPNGAGGGPGTGPGPGLGLPPPPMRNIPNPSLSTGYRQGELVRIAAATRPNGQPDEMVQSLQPVANAMSALDLALVLLAPAALISAIVGSLLPTRKVLKQIDGIRTEALRIRNEAQATSQRTGSELKELPKLQDYGGDELGELARTLNEMLGSLDAAFSKQNRLLSQQRRFTADASHELKSPLTVIQGNLELLQSPALTPEQREQILSDGLDEARRMNSLIRDLLLLASADEEQLGKNRVDVLAREIIESAVPIPLKPRIKLTVEPDNLSLLINEGQFTRAIRNLVENAVEASPPDKPVQIRVGKSGGNAVFEIEDEGAGIPSWHLARLGERFYRIDQARTHRSNKFSSGLGIPIAKEIVAAHGGELTYRSNPGTGTVARIVMPLTKGD